MPTFNEANSNWFEIADNIWRSWPMGGGGSEPSLTVTAVSQDQIDYSWTGSTGLGIEISRSDVSDSSGFEVVYYAAEETEAVSLYSHQEGTQYWSRARFMNPDGTFSGYSTVKTTTTTAAVNIYYVTKTGNDTTGDGSISTPYLTQQRAVWDATAGDVIYVAAGTYLEIAEWSPAAGGGNPTKFGLDLGCVFHNSGTSTAPIILQPLPGDEGLVITSQGTNRTAYHFHDVTRPWPDYIHIKGIEITGSFPISIWSVDNTGDWSDSISLYAQGVVIEGNNIHDTTFTTTGGNAATVRMDSAKQWTVRNNSIDASILNGGGYDANGSGCLYAYNMHDNHIVEFNNLQDGYTGVYWKDTTDNIPADTLQSTIRYNKFTNVKLGIYLNAGNAGTGNPGYHDVRRNIFDNVFSSFATTGDKQEARVGFYNNFVDYGTFGPTSEAYGQGVSMSQSTLAKEVSYSGNLMGDNTGTSTGTNLVTTELTSSKFDLLVSDYNITVEGPRVRLGAPAAYNTLAAWQAETSNSYISEPAPGANSLENKALSTLATDTSTDDYTIPALSTALAFMADSSNAGPYQYGNSTVVGVIS